MCPMKGYGQFNLFILWQSPFYEFHDRVPNTLLKLDYTKIALRLVVKPERENLKASFA